jgi:hypothetical protein
MREEEPDAPEQLLLRPRLLSLSTIGISVCEKSLLKMAYPGGPVRRIFF